MKRLFIFSYVFLPIFCFASEKVVTKKEFVEIQRISKEKVRFIRIEKVDSVVCYPPDPECNYLNRSYRFPFEEYLLDDESKNIPDSILIKAFLNKKDKEYIYNKRFLNFTRKEGVVFEFTFIQDKLYFGKKITKHEFVTKIDKTLYLVLLLPLGLILYILISVFTLWQFRILISILFLIHLILPAYLFGNIFFHYHPWPSNVLMSFASYVFLLFALLIHYLKFYDIIIKEVKTRTYYLLFFLCIILCLFLIFLFYY